MALYNAMPLSLQKTIIFGGLASGVRNPRCAGSIPNMNPNVTTYYYRTSGGTRSSTTSLAGVPVGAVVERVA